MGMLLLWVITMLLLWVISKIKCQVCKNAINRAIFSHTLYFLKLKIFNQTAVVGILLVFSCPVPVSPLTSVTSCSWPTHLKGFYVLCVLSCFSAHHSCKKRLIDHYHNHSVSMSLSVHTVLCCCCFSNHLHCFA